MAISMRAEAISIVPVASLPAKSHVRIETHRMESAGRLIGRVRLPANIVTSEDLVRHSWPRAVGKKIASHTEVVGIVRKCAVVEVADIVWQKHLHGLRFQILENVRKILGSDVITDIDFRPMGARRAPQKAHTVTSVVRPGDEAGDIADPILRRVYIQSRRKSSA